MSGILYLLALIAVAWLVAWSISDPTRADKIWWPFDMKGEPEKPKLRAWQARLRPDMPPRAAPPPAPPRPLRRR
jgi:hypothetical protein